MLQAKKTKLGDTIKVPEGDFWELGVGYDKQFQ